MPLSRKTARCVSVVFNTLCLFISSVTFRFPNLFLSIHYTFSKQGGGWAKARERRQMAWCILYFFCTICLRRICRLFLAVGFAIWCLCGGHCGSETRYCKLSKLNFLYFVKDTTNAPIAIINAPIATYIPILEYLVCFFASCNCSSCLLCSKVLKSVKKSLSEFVTT